MDQSPYLEANTHSDSNKIRAIPETKVHFRVRKTYYWFLSWVR